MQQGYRCPNCGQALMYVQHYQNWYCNSCGTYPFASQAPPDYMASRKDESSTLIWIIVIVVIIVVVLPIAAALLYVACSGQMSTTSTTPTGALDFTESTQTLGLFTGSFISLSKSVKVSDASVTITDDSTGNSVSQDPLNPGTTVQAGSGLNLTYFDDNNNDKCDGGDTIRVSNADTGDIIKFVYKPTGGVIASYCFI